MLPDVILFDVESPCPTAAFSLLETHPQRFLFGISPDSNLVRVWSEQRYRELCLKGPCIAHRSRCARKRTPRERPAGSEGGQE